MSPADIRRHFGAMLDLVARLGSVAILGSPAVTMIGASMSGVGGKPGPLVNTPSQTETPIPVPLLR